MNQSPFRFISCESPASVAGGFAKPAPGSTSLAIAASAEYVAAAGASAGNITIVNKSSEPFTISAHTKVLNHFVFSPFDDQLLSFSALGDNNLNLAQIGSSESSGITRIALSAAPIYTIWHPSCSRIVAACDSNNVSLLDIGRCSVLQTQTIKNASIAAADFSPDGAQISIAFGAGPNGKVVVFDPRTSASDAAAFDLSIGPHCIMNLQNDAQLVVLGQDPLRNPRLLWFDKRNSKAPILAESLPLSPGICISSHDAGTGLLSVSTRGSTNMMIFDLNRSDKLLHLTTYSSQAMFQGIAARPRRCLDLPEVGRIFQLTRSSIQTISLSVPRKSKSFSPDLFPDAVSNEPSLRLEDYLQGKNALPTKISLNPTQASDTVEQDTASQDCPDSTAILDSIDSQKSENRRKIESRLKKNLVANVSGQETRSLDSFWYGLKPSDVSMPLGMNLQANSTFILTAWKSLGASSIAVIKVDKPSRIEVQIPLLRAHGQPMTCFAVSGLDPGLLVTGCVDSHIRVWRFASDRFDANQPDLTEPAIDILTPGKVTFAALNPVSSSVLAVASQSPNSAILCFYDITSTESSVKPRLCIDCHPEAIASFFFSDDGNLIATVCKDRICRIFEPRRSCQAPLVSFEISEGVRDTYVIWIGQTGCVLTIGFGNASTRQMSLWSVLDSDQRALEGGAQLLGTHIVDQSSTTMVPTYDHDLGLLYVAGIGDRTILFFGIDLSKNRSEVIEPLGKYMCSSPISGITFLPKTMCNVVNVEVGTALYLTDDQVKPISFVVPRKRKEYFQDDLFPGTMIIEEDIPASDWLHGQKPSLSLKSLQPKGMERLSQAPPEVITEHQRKRLEYLAAGRKESAQPTVEEHIQKQLSNVESATIVTNRWDAQPIHDKAVAEDEWD